MFTESEEVDHILNESDDEKIKMVAYRDSARIYVAFIIGVGIVGNAACLFLYRRPSFCRYRSSRYLTALAISDLTSLLCLGLVWLKGSGFHWQDRSEFVCAASIFTSNSATFLSAWYVMLLTADMAWALRRPYRISLYEENKSILTRILAVTFVGFVANSWTWTAAKIVSDDELYDSNYNLSIFWNSPQHNGSIARFEDGEEKSSGGCQLTFKDDENFARCMIIFDMMVSFTIPLVVTLILNGYIGFQLMSSARKRRLLSQNIRAIRPSNYRSPSTKNMLVTMSSPRNMSPVIQQTACNETYTIIPLTVPAKNRVIKKRKSILSGLGKEATMSSLLIAKSLTYLILNLPTHAYRLWSILRDNHELTTRSEREHEFFLNMIVYLLFYTQFSLNFLLYSGHACKKRGH